MEIRDGEKSAGCVRSAFLLAYPRSDMKYLLEVAKAVAEGTSLDEIRRARGVHRAEIDGEVNSLISDEDVSLLAETLFGPEPRIDKGFYDVLTDFQQCTGYGPAYDALAGRIWASAFLKLPPESRLELLSGLLVDDQRGFWPSVRCLPTFCTTVELPAAFAAKWFHDLGTRVAGDWAGGDFYNAICRYAETFPESALAIFEQYVSQDLDPLTVHLAALPSVSEWVRQFLADN